MNTVTKSLIALLLFVVLFGCESKLDEANKPFPTEPDNIAASVTLTQPSIDERVVAISGTRGY